MTEDELLSQVKRMCEQRGLLWVHIPDSRRAHCSAGFPDILIAGQHGVLYRELKNDYGELRPDQQLWQWVLVTAGQDWDIWHPADHASGRIDAELDILS